MEDILNSKEYEFLKTNPSLGDNIVLLGYGGSLAYGTNTPTSDIDVRGVAARTDEDILLGKDFETIVDNNTDTTIYSFDKMLSLLADCNPNCIEILGLRPQDYLYKNNIGQELLENKNIFISKRCINTFGGYATQQLYRLRQKSLDALSPEEYATHIAKVISGMEEHLQSRWGLTTEQVHVYNDNSELKVDVNNIKNIPTETFYGMCNEISNVIKEYNKNSKRNNNALAHSKINKHAMHLIRLYMTCIDILEKQEIITYREKEHDLLMSIRNGEFSGKDGMMNADFWKLLEDYENKFEKAKEITTLPQNPDYNAINNLKIKVNRKIVEENNKEMDGYIKNVKLAAEKAKSATEKEYVKEK